MDKNIQMTTPTTTPTTPTRAPRGTGQTLQAPENLTMELIVDSNGRVREAPKKEPIVNDPQVDNLINSLEPDSKFRYIKFMETLHNRKIEHSHTHAIEAATQVKLMLRDGLSVEDLTEEERVAFVQVFGEDALKQYEDAGEEN